MTRCGIVLSVLLPCLVGCDQKVSDAPRPEPKSTASGSEARRIAPVSQSSEQQAAEALRIKRHEQSARRVGEILELKLRDGAWIKLENNSDPNAKVEEAINYTFLDYIDQIRCYSISVTYYESSGYLLVSATDGKQYFLDASPILSPKHDRFVTTSFCDFLCRHRLQIWKVGDDGLREETSIVPELLWARAIASWDGDDRIRIERELYEPAGAEEPKQKTVYLQKTQDTWKFTGGT